MKYLYFLFLIVTSCALPIRRSYIPKESPTVHNLEKKKTIVSNKLFKVPSFCSDSLTAVKSENNPIQQVKNPSPKVFDVYLMGKNSILFVSPKKGKISSGNNVIEIVLKSGESMFLREIDCHGKQMKMHLDKFVAN
jgi:hypothetical protein